MNQHRTCVKKLMLRIRATGDVFEVMRTADFWRINREMFIARQCDEVDLWEDHLMMDSMAIGRHEKARRG